MMPLSCPDCRKPLAPCYARAAFEGLPRRMHLRLDRIPAQACPACRVPVLDAEVRRHLIDLGAPLGPGWSLSITLSDRPAA